MYQVVVCCIHLLNEMLRSCSTDLVLNLEASVVISLQVLQCLRQVCHSNRQMDFCRRKKHKEQCTTTEFKRDRKKVLLHLPLYYPLAQLKLLHTTVLQHSADFLLLSPMLHKEPPAQQPIARQAQGTVQMCQVTKLPFLGCASSLSKRVSFSSSKPMNTGTALP